MYLSILRVHADFMMLQVLLGGFVCTDVPGQYTWRAGLLTQAVQQGHWLLLEDIDHAPLDLVSNNNQVKLQFPNSYLLGL